jgi:hypothetical protein
MQALLSFDQAPPLAAPLRFFLTAPLFAILAALLLLWSGPDLFASRWTGAALALTHLITVGFMLQVMLGAMLQILPVVAGANISRPQLLATLVNAAVATGALLLASGFLSYQPLLFELAAVLIGGGVALFIAGAGHALYGVPSTNATIRGLKLSLLGLTVTVCLGVLLAVAIDGSLALPLMQLTSIHLGWGFVGWSVVLLAAVAFVVVPMFQMTPAYPEWFAGRFSWTLLALLILWSVADSAGWQWLSPWLAAGGARGRRFCSADAAAAKPQQANPFRCHATLLAPGDAEHSGRLRAMACGKQLANPGRAQRVASAVRHPGAVRRLHVGNDRHALQDRAFSGLVTLAESRPRASASSEHEQGHRRAPAQPADAGTLRRPGAAAGSRALA